MSHEQDNIPQVDVICWDAYAFCVRCPYCDEIHHHAFYVYPSGLECSLCEEGGLYKYQFPIDEEAGCVAYEINKSKGRFENICMRQDLDEVDDEKELQLSNILSDVTVFGKLIGPLSTFDDAVWHCAEGRVAQVHKFLHDSLDATIFLHGQTPSGETTLIIASRGGISEMVSLLLSCGANVNAVNSRGRTALMEASLYGRSTNVELLLKHGANKNLRDNSKRSALDLNEPSRRNQKERRLRAHCKIIKALPVSKVTDSDRRKIRRLLNGIHVDSRTVYGAPPSVSECEDYAFRRVPEQKVAVFSGPLTKYPMVERYQTVAGLERGGLFPPITAMDGWNHSERRENYISGKQWTEQVIRIAELVGHVFPLDPEEDKGVPGRCNACHAEKQLVAYFLYKHVFLPEDSKGSEYWTKPIYEQISIIRRSFDEVKRFYEIQNSLHHEDEVILIDENGEEESVLEKNHDEMLKIEQHPKVKRVQDLERQVSFHEQRDAVYRNLFDMAKDPPPLSLKDPVIFVSSERGEACEDCKRFTEKVNEHFGLSIKLVECTVKAG